MAVKATMQWHKPIPKVVDEATGGDKTRLFMAQTWHKLYDPWTPMRTGTMAHDAVEYKVENKRGIIHHKAPYSGKQYNGKGFNFFRGKHPLASTEWDAAAKAAGKGKDLAQSTQAYIKGRR